MEKSIQIRALMLATTMTLISLAGSLELPGAQATTASGSITCPASSPDTGIFYIPWVKIEEAIFPDTITLVCGTSAAACSAPGHGGCEAPGPDPTGPVEVEGTCTYGPDSTGASCYFQQIKCDDTGCIPCDPSCDRILATLQKLISDDVKLGTVVA